MSLENNFSDLDKKYMKLALKMADLARLQNEVPAGAVCVVNNESVFYGMNLVVKNNDICAHAEIMALKAASKTLLNYRLPHNTILYSTLEPCLMCLGAILHARIGKLIFAAGEPKFGALISVKNSLTEAKWNHKLIWKNGLFEKESAKLLKLFFQSKR